MVLAAKKRLTKSQIRDDKFVDTIAHYAGNLREYQNYVLGGLALILIVVVAVSWGVRFKQGADSDSRLAFTSALKTLETSMASSEEADYMASLVSFEGVIEDYKSRETGRWAIYYSGYCKEHLNQFPEALKDYEEYLEVDKKGEFIVAARQGIASCMYSMGKPRPAAEILEQLAAGKNVNEVQSKAWLYRASQIYLEGQYYQDAKRVLEDLKPQVKGMVLTKVERDLEALKVLGS